MYDGEGRRVFAGVMKYFRHILIGNEIFLNIFNEPQIILLCSFLSLPLSKIIWKCKCVWAEKVQTGYQDDLRRIRHIQQQIKLEDFLKKISGGGGTRVMDLREYMDQVTFCYYHESIFTRQTGVFYWNVAIIKKIHLCFSAFYKN